MESQRGSVTCPQSHSWGVEKSGWALGLWARRVSGGAAPPQSGISGGGVAGVAAVLGGLLVPGAGGRPKEEEEAGLGEGRKGEEVTKSQRLEV